MQTVACGDLNADGLTDFAASDYSAPIHLYLGSAGGPVDPRYFYGGDGHGLAIGDVDGDGYEDLAASTSGPLVGSSGGGWVDVWRSGPSGPTLGSIWPQVASHGELDSWYGNSLDLEGDLNGDGLADLVVTDAGCARPFFTDVDYSDGFVHLGTPSGPAVQPSWRWLDVAPDEQCVEQIASAADINGDGYDELVISGEIEAWILYGSDAGPVGAPISLGARADGDWAWQTEPGWVWAAGLGDINDDGYGDLGYAYADTIDVHLGGPDGVLSDPIWRLLVVSDHNGRRVWPAGDFNGDGYGDIFGGAPWATVAGMEYAGSAGLWLGEPIDDIDQDGFLNGADCEPHRPWAFPGAPEVPGNPADDDCDGQLRCFVDVDGDGYGGPTTVEIPSTWASCVDAGFQATGADCWDADPLLGPQAEDLPEDDVDQDCDGYVICLGDLDGDGYGGPTPQPIPGTACSTADAHDIDGLDCDDTRPLVNPGVEEQPSNGLDDDCDGVIGCAPDADADGYGARDGMTWLPSPDTSCEHPGMSPDATDCNDMDPDSWPGAPEPDSDEIDQDCDGTVTCHQDRDGDGYGGPSGVRAHTCIGHPDPLVTPGIPGGDCRDDIAYIYPGAPEEPGDGSDEDCNGYLDCYISDRDGDDWGGEGDTVLVDATQASSCRYEHFAGNDCDPEDPRIHPPPNDERLLGVDEDCDGYPTCARDLDADGYGTDAVDGVWWTEQPSCGPPFDAALDRTDCDDTHADAHPGGAEVTGDTIDQDCDDQLQCWEDLDRDGFGGAALRLVPAARCDLPVAQVAARSGDCNDAAAGVHPDAGDPPGDGTDADCDGLDTFHLTVTPSPPTPGQPMTISVRGAPPGRQVTLVYSLVGPGAGPCPAALGGACLGLRAPQRAAPLTASATGRVTLSVTTPPVPVWLQAWVLAPTGPATGTAVVGVP